MFNNCKKKVNKNVREMGKLTQQHSHHILRGINT